MDGAGVYYSTHTAVILSEQGPEKQREHSPSLPTPPHHWLNYGKRQLMKFMQRVTHKS